uniref:Dynein light chain Tctex-type 1 n=1 Tax=Eptatretus burgeri TaxID=7764 RepID=A0A8C4R6W4_EPTBU
MDEYQGSDEVRSIRCDVQCVEAAIGGMSYQHSKVNQWSSNIVDQCLNHLAKLNKPFKYIEDGAGLHLASSCFWDNTTDGSCTVRWENKTIYCIVSVFGLAI